MSLQTIFTVFIAHPGRSLNVLALFFACAGAWLLLATRRRVMLAVARLDAPRDDQREAIIDGGPSLRVNRFFYQFGFACLAIALLLSWDSTRL